MAKKSNGRSGGLPPWLPDNLRSKLGGGSGSGRAGGDRDEGGSSRGGRKAGGQSSDAGGKSASASRFEPDRKRRGPAATSVSGRGGRPGHRFRDPHAEREAAKYEQPILSREAILQFLADFGEPLPLERIAHALGLMREDRREALARRLSAMVRDGQLLLNRRGAYAPAERLDLIPGVVIANADGFGFLRPDGGGDDLFLPPSQMREVMHGDRVLAALANVDARGRKEGAIVEVLERRATRLVGRYSEQGGVGLVVPDDRRMHQDLLIPPEQRGEARHGQIVVCEITEPPQRGRPPLARVVAVLGDALTPSLVVETAIHGHGIPHEWPQAALAEAARVKLEVGQADTEDRVDLRGLPLVTIDGPTAKDFDDAVYCETSRHGFRLVVAIADVSHYVRTGTALDDEAQKRATSVYFPGYVVPMLPETLSNGICSLNPRVDRLCFVCDMQIDHEGVVQRSKFYEAVMRSQARLTYDGVWAALGEQDEEARGALGDLLPHVERLHQLYQVLAKQRTQRGAIEFESEEIEFKLGPAGEVIQAESSQRNDAHKLIEECMIAANVEAAKFLARKKLPTPYRVHDRPPESKYQGLQAFLSEFGLRLPSWEKVTPHDFTSLLRKARKRPDALLLEQVLLRSQALAVYQLDNIGHFGLALEAYAHFTSPIRRYPDLLVHRAIKHALHGGKPDDFEYATHDMAALALHCSECGRRAEEAEREVDERYRCAWMEQHVGSEFDGVISGVKNFGLFVELVDSKISGLIHVTQLPNDYYHFDPQRQLMRGDRHGLELRLGDPVRVLVLRASLEERKIDFRLVEHRDAPIDAPASPRRETGSHRAGPRGSARADERGARPGRTTKPGKSDKAGRSGKAGKTRGKGKKR